MEKKFNKGNNKAMVFFKKNIYYILMAVCIIAVITMVTVAAVTKNKADVDVVTPPVEQPDAPDVIVPTPDDGDTDVVVPTPEPFVLCAPISGGDFAQCFADGSNLNLAQNRDGSWTVHLGLDYAAAEGTAVMASYKGVVKSIENVDLMGTVITIEHQDGFSTVYKLLSDEVNVKVGQSVSRGDVIGTVAEIAECQEGIKETHLHFELLKDGTEIDPTAYMAEGDK